MARDIGADGASEDALNYVHDHDPGLRRIPSEDGFALVDAAGDSIADPDILARVRALAIPPAWTDVWICADAAGHIQAVGRDARGRKQYRYHAAWRAVRDRSKYDRLLAFGRALPRLRTRIEADLARRGLPRDKVLAAVVRLLELTVIRVGNDEYARRNKSFGLTTLRKRHVKLAGAGAVFEFRGKSGVIHKTAFHDRRLATILRGCETLRGQRLFQYLDEHGERRPVGSHDVNAYLRAVIGEDFSAKDFRTWAGTLAAARVLAVEPQPATEAQAKRTIAACVKTVAGRLRNTPSVCRACYIHPAIFVAWKAGQLSPNMAREGRPAERALLRLLGDPSLTAQPAGGG
jgi:DNA topoisomerase-1